MANPLKTQDYLSQFRKACADNGIDPVLGSDRDQAAQFRDRLPAHLRAFDVAAAWEDDPHDKHARTRVTETEALRGVQMRYAPGGPLSFCEQVMLSYQVAHCPLLRMRRRRGLQ